MSSYNYYHTNESFEAAAAKWKESPASWKDIVEITTSSKENLVDDEKVNEVLEMIASSSKTKSGRKLTAREILEGKKLTKKPAPPKPVIPKFVRGQVVKIDWSKFTRDQQMRYGITEATTVKDLYAYYGDSSNYSYHDGAISSYGRNPGFSVTVPRTALVLATPEEVRNYQLQLSWFKTARMVKREPHPYTTIFR